MQHTKSTVAERPPLSARFIATEWFRGVGYALVTLITVGIAYVVGMTAIEVAQWAVKGKIVGSGGVAIWPLLPLLLVSAGVMGAGWAVAASAHKHGVAAVFRYACLLLLVLSFSSGFIGVQKMLWPSHYHCNCLGGPGW
ncbi:TPA: hypothetical protein SMF89_004851 [Serratia marcescens]|jgi:hypothetical protein|nr:hypothetical protein SME13J_50310 [Serratia marcescens]HEJ7174816.1 hypothetical protein [Serratia marcescens]